MKMEKTRISVVSYLNSKPFLYGLQKSDLNEILDISLDIPSKVAAKLTYNQADIGIIPVGALPGLGHYTLVSDYCIGAVGKVRTVIIASEVPIEQVDTILMDYQSRSSVMLARVLARHFWKKEFVWESTCAGFENDSISGRTAGVVIGDRVFTVEKRYPYIYDLSEVWMEFTGLPFVFAVWAANKPVAPETGSRLNRAFSLGINNLPEIAEKEKNNYPGVDILGYFTDNISFDLDEKKREGMHKFLGYVESLAYG